MAGRPTALGLTVLMALEAAAAVGAQRVVAPYMLAALVAQLLLAQPLRQ